ncbi:MAG TPA: RseA family anti-sigma factor [Rhodanobacteraceae bacterium]|nr:RseA family anti-sigma factor [Rhodanobacteraceae bacterium]
MSQPFEEELSAFMDGELGRDETRFLLKRVEGDGQAVRRWARYHLVRQTLRRHDVVALRADFATSLMARLDAESLPQARTNPWLRWGSGGAIAAAVAVTALMITKPATEPELAPTAATASTPNPPRPATVLSPAPSQVASTNPGLSPLVPNSPIQTTTASFGADFSQPAGFDPRLESYVIRHYQATGTTGQPEFVPYILLPVETPQPRPAENR